MSGLLEVVVLDVEDARRAEAGGADRLMLVGELRGQGISPEPDQLERVVDACSLPVRPLLRLREGYRTDGGEATRLKGLLADYLDRGADGVVLGFLDGYNEVDVEVVTALVGDSDFAWTFDRAIDRTIDGDESWDRLMKYDGLDAVLTAGSVRGLTEGLDDLVRRAQDHPEQAAVIQASGGLEPEHVAWLTRAGISQFQIARQARRERSFAENVDDQLVKLWRILLDTP